MTKKNFYVTTPIYYVNSSPHLGHAYTSILCDVAARYHQFSGKDVFFLTGTDEHGDKIQKSAELNNKTPQEFVDEISADFKKLLPAISVKNNDFIRTTDTKHKKVVQDLLQKVYDSGDIYFTEYTGKYCFGCERFLGDDELVDGLCPDHQKAPEEISESNYFFKMSKYWDQLKTHIEKNEKFIVPDNFKKEVLGLLKQDPQDLCISRPKSRLKWGIELPFDSNFVTYVWFDALINYLSGIDYQTNENFATLWNNSHHVIAKDILKPHCIYWPTMLMSMGISLPKQIAIHGYWLMGDTKMSKSQGKTIDPLEYCEKYSTDIFRYFLMKNMNFGRDASFTQEEFINSINSDLANNLGNLYSRVAGMCRKNFDSKIPPLYNTPEEASSVESYFSNLKSLQEEALTNWEMNKYLGNIIEMSNKVNKFLDETKPWKLAKDPEKTAELASILRLSLESVRIIFAWIYPVMPSLSEKITTELGLSNKPEDIYRSANTWNSLNEGHLLPSPVTGIPRIEE